MLQGPDILNVFSHLVGIQGKPHVGAKLLPGEPLRNSMTGSAVTKSQGEEKSVFNPLRWEADFKYSKKLQI